MGKAPKNEVSWKVQVNRVNQLDHFILDWLECKPKQVSEIFPYMQNLDSAADLLNEALKLGGGAFVASAHIGLLFAGPVALNFLKLDSAWIASVPDLEDNRFGNSLISTSSESESQVGRNILKSLKANKVVAIACDGSSARKESSYKLFNSHNIVLSEFIPRLAFKKKTPSFFPHIIWENNMIAVTLIKMPDPFEGEFLDDFTSRWVKFFLSQLEALIIKYPSSIRGSGGFWTALKR